MAGVNREGAVSYCFTGVDDAGKLTAIMPEINTLSPKPRRVLGWVWMIMMVTALLAAIGRAVFG